MRVSSSSLRTKKAVFKPVAASNLRWLLRLVVPLESNMSISVKAHGPVPRQICIRAKSNLIFVIHPRAHLNTTPATPSFSCSLR